MGTDVIMIGNLLLLADVVCLNQYVHLTILTLYYVSVGTSTLFAS